MGTRPTNVVTVRWLTTKKFDQKQATVCPLHGDSTDKCTDSQVAVQYYEDSDPAVKYMPGRRHKNFSLDPNAPFHYNRRV